MNETLRDRLAAVLGPGNNDATAYAQADAVLAVLDKHAVVLTIEEGARLHKWFTMAPTLNVLDIDYSMLGKAEWSNKAE